MLNTIWNGICWAFNTEWFFPSVCGIVIIVSSVIPSSRKWIKKTFF